MTKRYFTLFAALAILIFGLVSDTINMQLFNHIRMSLFRMISGYSIAVISGLATALLLGVSKYMRYAFKPILSFLISIPTITWVPLLLIITGISETTIIITIFLGSYFAIVYNTLDGFDNIDPSLINVGKMLEYSKITSIMKIFVPASLNNIIVGLKLGIAYSWRALVGAEMLGATQFGLGFRVFASRKFYDVHGLIMALLLIGFIGYLMNRALLIFFEEKTVLKWSDFN